MSALELDQIYLPPVLTAGGIDVGPHTGVFAASWRMTDWKLLDAVAFECRQEDAAARLEELLTAPDGLPFRIAGIEAFVPRMKATRLRGVQAAKVMGQVRELTVLMEGHGIRVIARPAGMVKPWATGKRLEAAGLLGQAGSSAHIRDAARHMLFSACQAGLPDPLSAIMQEGAS